MSLYVENLADNSLVVQQTRHLSELKWVSSEGPTVITFPLL